MASLRWSVQAAMMWFSIVASLAAIAMAVGLLAGVIYTTITGCTCR
jgi:hypothetical protein